jgi:hypothetical protein
MDLDARGVSVDDTTLQLESFFDDDPSFHAPSEYVWNCQRQRDERKRRDREELQDLWREEVQARKRETAFLLYRSAR